MILAKHTITPKHGTPSTFWNVLSGGDRYAYIEWSHDVNYDFGIRDNNEDKFRTDTETWDEDQLKKLTLDDLSGLPLGILAKILHKLSVD